MRFLFLNYILGCVALTFAMKAITSSFPNLGLVGPSPPPPPIVSRLRLGLSSTPAAEVVSGAFVVVTVVGVATTSSGVSG